MDFAIKVATPEKQRGACAVVGVFETRKMTESAKALDKIAQGHLKNILASGDMDGKASTSLLLHNVPGTLFKRILLIGLGKEQEFKEKNISRRHRRHPSRVTKNSRDRCHAVLVRFPA